MTGGALRLTGGRVVTPQGAAELLDVTIADGTIIDVERRATTDCDVVHDVSGMYVAPGFIDLQLNGGWGHDFTTDPQSIGEVACRLPSTGVTAFLPTIVTAHEAARWAALDWIATSAATFADGCTQAALPLGLHFEGPAISPARLGAHDRRWIGLPRKEEVDAWTRGSGVAMVTLAPECEGVFDLIASLIAAGVVVSVGHSECSPDQFAAAHRAGAGMVTHLFNAMAPFSHRDPGLVGSVLAGDGFAGLICDGIHVDPLAVKVAWRALGPERMVLVSDAMAALGLDAARTQLGDATVFIDETGVRNRDGILAGSNLQLDQAVRNLVEFTGCPPAEAISTVTRNPAAALGIADRGRIAVGARADIVVLDTSLRVVQTFVGGDLAWRS
jgi:N-acetylglucosamine-6-phosphate deacetylase